MEEPTYTLYIHTSPSGKKYVGITSNDVRIRWNKGNGYRSSYFHNAIKKYGWENMEHEIIETGLSKEDAIRLEKEYIQKYETTNRSKGYNISLGGEVPANNIADLEEYRLKQSLRSHEQWEKGKLKFPRHRIVPHSFESKYKKKVYQYDKEMNLIAVHDSVKSCAKALGVTEMPVSETCNGKAETCKGFILRFENDSYLSDGKKGSHCARKVEQIDLNGEVLNRFDSASEAARSLDKTTPCSILDACRGKQITAYGYKWRFQQDA